MTWEDAKALLSIAMALLSVACFLGARAIERRIAREMVRIPISGTVSRNPRY